MNLDELKDRLIGVLQSIGSRIEESELYARLREKFDTLSAPIQKVIVGSVVTLILLIIFAIPYSMYSNGSDTILYHEDHRDALVEMYRIEREKRLIPAPMSQLTAMDLPRSLESLALTANIPRDQVEAVNEFDNATAPGGSARIPKSIQQRGARISFKNLNLTQIQQYGQKLMNLDPNARITGLEIQAGTQGAGYFDAAFKVVIFSLPERTSPAGASRSRK
ncbi:MAG TPA: hypothetical protein PLZ57_10165 [Pseudobdellovibrionaceae bacterium]|nr:hypothetical protein [Pseudobdellovibrionaceae bacterium]